MPLYEYACAACGRTHELIVFASDPEPACPACGGALARCMSPTSSLTGRAAGGGLPGPGDTACCGSAPGMGGCAGPGSCCGHG